MFTKMPRLACQHSSQRPNSEKLQTRCLSVVLVHSVCVSVVSQVSVGRITPEPPIGKGIVVLKAARLIDGTGAAPINNAVVVVTDNTITAVGAAGSVSVPANARMIDLGDVTLMPGFIDAHTHLIGRVLGDPAGDNALVRDFESFGGDSQRAECARHFDGGVYDRSQRRRSDSLTIWHCARRSTKDGRRGRE